MASVWYIGTSSKRVMSAADWGKAGTSGADAEWSAANGYSILQANFTAQQLAVLMSDGGFLKDQPDTPRPGSSVVVNPNRPVTYAEVVAMLAAFTPGGGTAPTTKAGKELAAARRLSQFSWSGTDWVQVEGLVLYVSALTEPVYVEASLGLVVANGTADAPLYVRILNEDTAELVAFGPINVPGLSIGYNSGGMPNIKGRIPAGTVDHRYVVQVQSVSGALCYIVPDWLPGAAADFRAVGA